MVGTRSKGTTELQEEEHMENIIYLVITPFANSVY